MLEKILGSKTRLAIFRQLFVAERPVMRPRDEARQLRPHLRVDAYPVLRQDADMLAEPVRLDGDIALQRLGDLIQYRPHIQVQGRALVVGQQLAGETEAEGLLAADSHRRQRVGLVGQPEPVPGVVVGQRGAFLISQEVQVPRHRAARDLELVHEVRAVGQRAGIGALAHHLDHAPDAVVLRSETRFHFSQSFFRGVPLNDTPSFIHWSAWWSKSIVRADPRHRPCGNASRSILTGFWTPTEATGSDMVTTVNYHSSGR